ncbi:hypothetical protein PR048_021120 [Dryococelus australis]|uniref:CST complex subunit CTC1 n=1 Tax=Dryococelus australis TaxID=614101 RepID=A0ABQ9GXB1_9NEOP|nr:hypothetical protein PR048_021120 [Dryococelus australis]
MDMMAGRGYKLEVDRSGATIWRVACCWTERLNMGWTAYSSSAHVPNTDLTQRNTAVKVTWCVALEYINFGYLRRRRIIDLPHLWSTLRTEVKVISAFFCFDEIEIGPVFSVPTKREHIVISSTEVKQQDMSRTSAAHAGSMTKCRSQISACELCALAGSPANRRPFTEQKICCFSSAQISPSLELLPNKWSERSPPTSANWVRFPAWSLFGFLYVGIVPDDVAGLRVFSHDENSHTLYAQGSARRDDGALVARGSVYLTDHVLLGLKQRQNAQSSGPLKKSTSRHQANIIIITHDSSPAWEADIPFVGQSYITSHSHNYESAQSPILGLTIAPAHPGPALLSLQDDSSGLHLIQRMALYGSHGHSHRVESDVYLRPYARSQAGSPMPTRFFKGPKRNLTPIADRIVSLMQEGLSGQSPSHPALKPYPLAVHQSQSKEWLDTHQRNDRVVSPLCTYVLCGWTRGSGVLEEEVEPRVVDVMPGSTTAGRPRVPHDSSASPEASCPRCPHSFKYSSVRLPSGLASFLAALPQLSACPTRPPQLSVCLDRTKPAPSRGPTLDKDLSSSTIPVTIASNELTIKPKIAPPSSSYFHDVDVFSYDLRIRKILGYRLAPGNRSSYMGKNESRCRAILALATADITTMLRVPCPSASPDIPYVELLERSLAVGQLVKRIRINYESAFHQLLNRKRSGRQSLVKDVLGFGKSIFSLDYPAFGTFMLLRKCENAYLSGKVAELVERQPKETWECVACLGGGSIPTTFRQQIDHCATWQLIQPSASARATVIHGIELEVKKSLNHSGTECPRSSCAQTENRYHYEGFDDHTNRFPSLTASESWSIGIEEKPAAKLVLASEEMQPQMNLCTLLLNTHSHCCLERNQWVEEEQGERRAGGRRPITSTSMRIYRMCPNPTDKLRL